MKRVLSTIATLALTGCASYATDAERDAATQPWQECVTRAVDKLDDGKSDPVSIAYGIEPACSTESEQVLQTFEKGMITEEGQTYARNHWKDDETRLIVDIVLHHRASQRSQSNSDDPNDKSWVWGAITAADNRHDYATEIELLRPLAEQGNAAAEVGLGVIYVSGNGVPQNDAEAISWFRKAAENGHGGEAMSVAEGALGYMYENGRGVPKDYVQAYTWLSLAIANGYDKAINGRERLKERMTAEQVAESQRTLDAWRGHADSPPPASVGAQTPLANSPPSAAQDGMSPQSPSANSGSGAFHTLDQWEAAKASTGTAEPN